ncbi:glycosyl transferase [Rivularia sp. PCC 7116]|uniref:glycosyltransferase family 2 protein n=1 Tax=Rivularia sp. PCC 7116 TaxID=373994 RepID=UPI00029EF7BA|nr:glycosyltransferase [Rivularia sp. PCC 7116]AFY53121.1 glycosyl transferase [Rivularia sp. PCC 7116]
MTLVSIIITSYNKAAYLEQAVKSVLAQSYSNIECIIVDDGSTDKTAEIAQELIAKYPQIQYFIKPNGGISSARNFGNSKANGEWIQFLDADDWIHEDKIRFQLEYLQTFSGQEAFAYADYQRVYVDKNHRITKRISHQVGQLSKEELIHRLLICPDFLAKSPFPLLQQAMLFKKSIFDNYQFDETLKACEDRELMLYLLMNSNISYVYTPIIGAYYRKHSANLTDNGLLMRESYIRYFEIVKQKHRDSISLNNKSLDLLVDKAIELRDTYLLARVARLIKFPTYIFDGNIRVSNYFMLRTLYTIRLALPNFILYKHLRGPRSQKIIAWFSKFKI